MVVKNSRKLKIVALIAAEFLVIRLKSFAHDIDVASKTYTFSIQARCQCQLSKALYGMKPSVFGFIY